MALPDLLFSSFFGGGNQGVNYQPTQPISTQQMGQLWGQQQAAAGGQQAFVNALTGMNAQTFGQQQALASQLAAQAQGQGPNIAAEQLAQATGQNVQRQAALMASQRGASQNAGALARMASEQGAGLQQQAINQASMLRANQQLAAQQALGQMTGQMINQQAGAMGMQGQLAQYGMQSGLGAMAQYNAVQAELAKQQAQQQAGMFGGIMQAAGAGLGFLAGGPAGMAVGAQLGGGLGGMGTKVESPQAAPQERFDTAPMKAHGGMIQNYAYGGMAPMQELPPGGFLRSYANGLNMSDGGQVPGKAKFGGDDYGNDTVHAMLSPGEIVIPRTITQGANAAEKSAKFVQAILAKKGARK